MRGIRIDRDRDGPKSDFSNGHRPSGSDWCRRFRECERAVESCRPRGAKLRSRPELNERTRDRSSIVRYDYPPDLGRRRAGDTRKQPRQQPKDV
jgi:hypothetical protein